jgi:molybdate/tungstate transport system substrate-binding protein
VKNLEGAISFGDFILSTDGKNILKDEGLNPIKPVLEGDMARVPTSVKSILMEEKAIN